SRDQGAPWLAFVASGVLVLANLPSSRADEPQTAAAILQDLRHFRVLGSVLHVAAHPDDENTQLITYLARGRGYRTADLSLSRVSGPPRGTHGRHPSSAILALAAFRVAGDPQAFPEQLRDLAPWQPKRILQNGGGGRGGGGGNAGAVQMDVGGTDPVLGMSFG